MTQPVDLNVAAKPDGLATLSPAERVVPKHIARNMTTQQIAQALGVSSKTVQNHRSKICSKLGVTGTMRCCISC
jgi:DNA-binding CsgD family transcriptional regulator